MMKEDLKIVVLDGYTLNPGDLSWKDLEALGTVKIYDRTHPGEVVERATGAQIVLTNKTVLDGEALSQLPDLKYIGFWQPAIMLSIWRLPADKGLR